MTSLSVFSITWLQQRDSRKKKKRRYTKSEGTCKEKKIKIKKEMGTLGLELQQDVVHRVHSFLSEHGQSNPLKEVEGYLTISIRVHVFKGFEHCL